jgi:hypothetical protein
MFSASDRITTATTVHNTTTGERAAAAGDPIHDGETVAIKRCGHGRTGDEPIAAGNRADPSERHITADCCRVSSDATIHPFSVSNARQPRRGARRLEHTKPPRKCPTKLKEWPSGGLTERNWIAICGDLEDDKRLHYTEEVLPMRKSDRSAGIDPHGLN